MKKESNGCSLRPWREKVAAGRMRGFTPFRHAEFISASSGYLNGFTLIELLVVVIIIAILAAIAVPQYKHAALKSRFSTVMPMAKSVADAQEVYYQGRQLYALDVDELDVTPVTAENTSVTLSQTDGYDYVMAQNSKVPGANYIIYQKYSENYPSEIHCEAEDDNADAQWLCGVLSNNNSIGQTITAGYTTYLINGTGAGVVPGSTGGDESGGNSEPATPMCSGEQPVDITASQSGATGTASCVNGKWVYEWTGGATYNDSYASCTSNSAYACAGSFSGWRSRCTGTATNACAGSFSGKQSSCNGNATNACADAEIQAGAYCYPGQSGGCDGALYGAHSDKDSSLIGSCDDSAGYCPTGVPLKGSWNENTQSYDISGWKGNCCNPAYMVSGECPSGIAICS